MLSVKGVSGTVTGGHRDTSGSACNLNKGRGRRFFGELLPSGSDQHEVLLLRSI